MDINALLHQQAGVIARRQALASGLSLGDIQRLLRRREWARVSAGVFVTHTGPLTDEQREWAAILAHRCAALAGRTVLLRAGIACGTDRRGSRWQPALELVVPHTEAPVRRPGIVVTRRRDFAAIVHPARLPPTVRIEDAALDVAQATDEATAVAILSDACRSRQTTAARLAQAAERRPRLRQRAFLIRVLADAAAGSHSLLEWRYRKYVEREHGLPAPARQDQAKSNARSAYRDVHYKRYGVVVELDGRLGHELALDRWADLDRDLASAVAGIATLRLGWGQVLEPCRIAAVVAEVLIVHGWEGRPTTCGPACLLQSSGEIRST